ncbi:MAG: hypothetical protein R2827_04490 [Bdellovibrionales bacterium]
MDTDVLIRAVAIQNGTIPWQSLLILTALDPQNVAYTKVFESIEKIAGASERKVAWTFNKSATGLYCTRSLHPVKSSGETGAQRLFRPEAAFIARTILKHAT